MFNATLAFRGIQHDLRMSWDPRFQRPQELCLKTKWESRPNIKRGMHLYWSSHLIRTTTTITSTSIRDVSSLPIQRVYLCYNNQFNSTLVKAIDKSTGLTVHQQIIQSSDKFWIVYLDTHNDFPWNPDKIKLTWESKLTWSPIVPVNRKVSKTLEGVL